MRAYRLILPSLLIALICAWAVPVLAANTQWYLDFEGEDLNWSPVMSIAGISFGTESEDSLIYADRRSSDWRIEPGSGAPYSEWEYWVAGNVGVASPFADVAVISFTDPAVGFKVGYSSYFSFVAEAYNAANELIATTTGAANSKSNQGSGLGYLELVGDNISYVRLYTVQGVPPSAGYWLIDDVTVTFADQGTIVPEQPAFVLAAMSMLAPAGMLLRRRK